MHGYSNIGCMSVITNVNMSGHNTCVVNGELKLTDPCITKLLRHHNMILGPKGQRPHRSCLNAILNACSVSTLY